MDEVTWVIEKGWVKPQEQMNEEYLGYILTEKDVDRAVSILKSVLKKTKPPGA